MSKQVSRSHEEIWRAWDAMEARVSAPLSERMLELAALGPGMRVLDLATGRGEPAVRAAKRVSPGGQVLGIDVSAPMLEMAKERATAEGVTNLELRVGDAAAPGALLEAHFDVALSRWGLMYMQRPVAALDAARRALKPGGVLVAALWAEPERVPWFSLPRRTLEPFCRVPPVDLEAPGTFRYAAPERVERDFASAGLVLTHAEELHVDVLEAASDAELLAWAKDFVVGPLLSTLPEAQQAAWERGFLQAAAAHRRDGVVRLGGVTRLVVASSPG